MDKYKLIESIDSFINVLGIIGVNTKESFKILAYPSKGFMKVKYHKNPKN